MTFSASANPIAYQGATPIFVDSESETWNMCPHHLEEAIKDRIKKGKKPKDILEEISKKYENNIEIYDLLSKEYIKNKLSRFKKLLKREELRTITAQEKYDLDH